MPKLLIVVISALLSFPSSAGKATGIVTEIRAAPHSPVVLFKLDAPIEDTPRCNEAGRFAFDTKHIGGPGMLDVLLSAKQNGYTISVEGLNTCSAEWKSEGVKNIIAR